MPQECIFCKIIKGEIPSRMIHESEVAIAFLDIHPATRGHTLVVPREHFKDMEKAPRTVINQLLATISNVVSIIKEKLPCKALNVLINQGKPAGQVIDHFHVHVIPRHENDGLSFPRSTTSISEKELDEIHVKLTQ